MIKKLFILTILCITHSLCFAINKVTSITIDQLVYEVISSSERTVSVSSIPTGCSGDITIPSTVEIGGVTHTVTTIGELAFFECKRLTSVNIPNSVTSIGEDAFGESFRLKSVNIPKSVSYIGANAFYGCSGLTEVYYGAENPIEGSSNIFSDYITPTLYVPEGAIEKYKQINPWKNFYRIEAHNFAGFYEITADIDSEKYYDVYNLNGVALGNSTDNLTKGIYIIRQGSIVKKITVK